MKTKIYNIINKSSGLLNITKNDLQLIREDNNIFETIKITGENLPETISGLNLSKYKSNNILEFKGINPIKLIGNDNFEKITSNNGRTYLLTPTNLLCINIDGNTLFNIELTNIGINIANNIICDDNSVYILEKIIDENTRSLTTINIHKLNNITGDYISVTPHILPEPINSYEFEKICVKIKNNYIYYYVYEVIYGRNLSNLDELKSYTFAEYKNVFYNSYSLFEVDDNFIYLLTFKPPINQPPVPVILKIDLISGVSTILYQFLNDSNMASTASVTSLVMTNNYFYLTNTNNMSIVTRLNRNTLTLESDIVLEQNSSPISNVEVIDNSIIYTNVGGSVALFIYNEYTNNITNQFVGVAHISNDNTNIFYVNNGEFGYLTKEISNQNNTKNYLSVNNDGDVVLKNIVDTPEIDPTVPNYVKAITQNDIDKWNYFSNNLNNDNFIEKTYDELLTLKNDNLLIPNKWYKVTGIMSNYYSGHNIISYHFAINNNTLDDNAFANLPISVDVLQTILFFNKGTITGTLNDVSVYGQPIVVVSNTGKEFYYLFNGAIKIKDSISLTELAQCNTFTDKYNSNNYISNVSLRLTEINSDSYKFNANYIWSYYGRTYKLLNNGFIPGIDLNDYTKLDSNYAQDITYDSDYYFDINMIKYDLENNIIFYRKDNNNNCIDISKSLVSQGAKSNFKNLLLAYKFVKKGYYIYSNNYNKVTDLQKIIFTSKLNLGFSNNYFENCYIDYIGGNLYQSNSKFNDNILTNYVVILGLAGYDLSFSGNIMNSTKIYCIGGMFFNNWFSSNNINNSTIKNTNGLRFFRNKIEDSQILNLETDLIYTYFTDNNVEKTIIKDLSILRATNSANNQLYIQNNVFFNSNINNIIKSNIATNGIVRINNKKFNNFNFKNSQNNYVEISNDWTTSTHLYNDYDIEFLTSYNGLLKLSKIVDNGIQILDYNS